ncbi:MAG: hypothetical protein AAGD01_05290 [Acidobacteriota bacterium]
MMNGDADPGHRFPIRVTFPASVSKATVAVGAFTTLFSAIGLVLAFSRFGHRYQLAEVSEGGRASIYLSTTILAVFGTLLLFCLLILGLREAITGLRRVLQPIAESKGPEPFGDFHGDLIPALQGDRLVFSTARKSSKLRMLFGARVENMPPTIGKIVSANGRSLYSRLFTVPAILFIILLATYAGASFSLLMVVGLVLAGSLFQGAVEFLGSKQLIPESPQVAEVHGRSRHYRGFGHPTHLFARLPILANPLALGRFKNTCYQWGYGERGGVVADVGEFSGTLFIERQPQVIESPLSRGGVVFLGGAWCLQIASIALITLLLSPVADGFLDKAFTVLACCGVTSVLAIRAAIFRSQAEKLLWAVHFKSIAILMLVSGDLSKADVSIGQANHDSIRSSNLTARSNFTVRFWAAEVTSEASSIIGKRRLVDVAAEGVSLQWLDHLEGAIETLREETVRAVGIDFQAPEAYDISVANQQLLAQKLAKVRGTDGDRAEAVGEAGPQLTPGTEEEPRRRASSPDLVECPFCAELVRPKAVFCRHCRSELSPQLGAD